LGVSVSCRPIAAQRIGEACMDLELKDKVAIVTGASRGIGAAAAHVLASEGADVFLGARSGDDLAKVAAEITKSTGRRAVTFVGDFSDPGVPEAAVAACMKAYGRLDILVNNAGATKRGDFFKLTEEDWASGFGLKFFSTVRMTRNAWPHLRAAKGSIVNIIGIGSRTASAEFTIGGSVNSALVNFTKATGDIGRTDGVRVNAINPGHVATSRLDKRIETAMSARNITRDMAVRDMIAELGINRFGEPEEIGRLVAFLCSPKADFIQSTVIDMNGGETLAL
jgi:NAD(P)-dependent dehydrogenase (short-subunit alcohol dehydrogenase family)